MWKEFETKIEEYVKRENNTATGAAKTIQSHHLTINPYLQIIYHTLKNNVLYS